MNTIRSREGLAPPLGCRREAIYFPDMKSWTCCPSAFHRRLVLGYESRLSSRSRHVQVLFALASALAGVLGCSDDDGTLLLPPTPVFPTHQELPSWSIREEIAYRDNGITCVGRTAAIWSIRPWWASGFSHCRAVNGSA